MNLDSARGLELWHKARIPTDYRAIFAFFTFEEHGPEVSVQTVAYSFPCSSTERNVRCVVWNASRAWSDPTNGM